MFFKFQSDSINTKINRPWMVWLFALNSNLILLIQKATLKDTLTCMSLNSNLILLIPDRRRIPLQWRNAFKFQSDSINTSSLDCVILSTLIFKFQSDSINTFLVNPVNVPINYTLNSNLILLIHTTAQALMEAMIFKFQSDSINTCKLYIWLVAFSTLNSNLILLIRAISYNSSAAGWL